MLPHAIEIVQVRQQRDVIWIDVLRRLTASSLIVVNETKLITQSVEVGKEVAMIEVGTSVENDDRLSFPDDANIERCGINFDTALVGFQVCVHLRCVGWVRRDRE